MRFVAFFCACASLFAQSGALRIGRETQLFLDDFSVDRMTGLERRLHQAVKRGPILDEQGGPFGVGGVYMGNIVYRDAKGRFHMLYRYPWDDPSVASLHPSIGQDKAHWFRESVAYATSEDGIRWKKPVLGLVEGPASFRKEGPYTVAASVSKKNNLGVPIDFMYDLNAHGNVADPNKHFLLRISRKDDTHPFAKVIESGLYFAKDWPDFAGNPDWRSKLEPIPDGKLSPRGFLTLAGYDEQARVWFQVCQGRVGDWSKREGREIVRYESPDLVHWSGPEVVLPIQPDESKEPGDYVEYMNLDAYRVGGPKTGAWLGQLLIFRSDRTNRQYRMPRSFTVWRKGLTELRLVMSRDAGKTWQRVGGKQVWMTHGNEEHGYDRLVFGHYPIRVGDELWMYFSAWNGDHLAYNYDGSLYYKEGFLRTVTTARATWRWDGYMSLDAGARGGELVTKPLVFDGTGLAVNFEARGGELRAELQDVVGKAIPGYSSADCVPVRGDGVALDVRWRGHDDVGSLAGKTVRAVFRFKDGSLYSYQFR